MSEVEQICCVCQKPEVTSLNGLISSRLRSEAYNNAGEEVSVHRCCFEAFFTAYVRSAREALAGSIAV